MSTWSRRVCFLVVPSLAWCVGCSEELRRLDTAALSGSPAVIMVPAPADAGLTAEAPIDAGRAPLPPMTRAGTGAAAGMAGSAGQGLAGAAGAAPTPAPTKCADAVGPVPDELRKRLQLDTFYQQYLSADGIPVLASNEPDPRSLTLACELLVGMLAERDDVRRKLIDAEVRFVIIGAQEGTAEVPEYGYGPRSQADKDQINQRARGLGGQVASCGEENMLCLKGDRYWDESICLHEFSHTIATYGVYAADKTFEQRLTQSYQRAKTSGILDDTYRKENAQEYWAEGVQDWYDSNANAEPSNGIHNAVDTRVELKSFDPTLYDLVDEVFPTTLTWKDCHAQ